MKILLLLLPLVLSADSVTYTYTATAVNATTCGGYLPGCAPLEFDIPEFDPGLGAIDSIEWTFADTQDYAVNIAYWGSPVYGGSTNLLAWQTTEGDTSAQLGLDASATQNQSCYCAADWFWTGQNDIEASGTIGDPSAYIGTGTIAIFVQPGTSQTDPGFESTGVYTSLLDTSDDATLTLSYIDTPAVQTPEPSEFGIVALLALVVLCAKREGWLPAI